jgi:hypothetical protein
MSANQVNAVPGEKAYFVISYREVRNILKQMRAYARSNNRDVLHRDCAVVRGEVRSRDVDGVQVGFESVSAGLGYVRLWSGKEVSKS